MDNTDAISAIQGRLTVLASEDSVNAKEEGALNAALTVLQNGYQSDITTATASLQPTIDGLNSQISALQARVDAANTALTAANLPTV